MMSAKKKSKLKVSNPRKVAQASPAGSWSMEDLPVHLQVELRDRVEQAKRGEGLKDFDDAMADAERMTDEIMAIIAPRTQRSSV